MSWPLWTSYNCYPTSVSPAYMLLDLKIYPVIQIMVAWIKDFLPILRSLSHFSLPNLLSCLSCALTMSHCPGNLPMPTGLVPNCAHAKLLELQWPQAPFPTIKMTTATVRTTRTRTRILKMIKAQFISRYDRDSVSSSSPVRSSTFFSYTTVLLRRSRACKRPSFL